jgi:hypothetical protein
MRRITTALLTAAAALFLLVAAGPVGPGMLSLSASTTSAEARSDGSLDTSGMRAFWSVASALQQGKPLSAGDWRALYRASGYRLYLDGHEARAQALKRRMQLVFDPDREAALQDTLARVGSRLDPAYRPLHALIYAKREEDSLRAFQARLESTDFVRRAARDAERLLPSGALRGADGRLQLPPVRLHVYNLDGRGRSDQIVFDLALLSLLGSDAARLSIAHEFHHAGRRQAQSFDLPAPEEDPRAGILRTIDRLQSEGTADLLDKAAVQKAMAGPVASDPEPGRPWIETLFSAFNRRATAAYDATPSTLRRVDSLIVAAARADADGNAEALGRLGRELMRATPRQGHPNGHYMAALIAEAHGRSVLADSVANPFSFVRLYNEAARKQRGDAAPLSGNAMRYLASLERQYVAD